jgi:multiple sugar transport system substrate-binding protein
MRSPQRRVRLMAATVATLLLATACTGGAQQIGTVKILISGAPEELAAFRTLATAYEQAVPGADIQLVEASDAGDLITRLSTSIAGGAPPDIFLINYREYGQFAGKDAIEPVGERLTASKTIKTADFYPAPMEAFRWAGQQMCMPQNASSLALYYNRSLFQRYGIAEPKSGWTWSDLITTATALTRDANGAIVKGTESEGTAQKVAVYGLGVDPQIIRVAPFVWSNGGQFVDDPQKPSRFTFNQPQAREALKNFLELRVGYGVIPTDEEIEAEDAESRFGNGRIAMLLQSRRVTPTFRKITAFDWDVAPLPMYAKTVSILHSDAYCITRGSSNKDGAWSFVEFAMGAEGQRIIAGTGRTVPSNIEVSQSAAFLDPTKPPLNAKVFLDAIPTLQRVPTVSTWPEIEDVTNGILENALYRGDVLDDVIRELDEKTRPLFARAAAP